MTLRSGRAGRGGTSARPAPPRDGSGGLGHGVTADDRSTPGAVALRRRPLDRRPARPGRTATVVPDSAGDRRRPDLEGALHRRCGRHGDVGGPPDGDSPARGPAEGRRRTPGPPGPAAGSGSSTGWEQSRPAGPGTPPAAREVRPARRFGRSAGHAGRRAGSGASPDPGSGHHRLGGRDRRLRRRRPDARRRTRISGAARDSASRDTTGSAADRRRRGRRRAASVAGRRRRQDRRAADDATLGGLQRRAPATLTGDRRGDRRQSLNRRAGDRPVIAPTRPAVRPRDLVRARQTGDRRGKPAERGVLGRGVRPPG